MTTAQFVGQMAGLNTGIIDTTEAARRLGISRRRVLKLIDDERLPAERLGARQWVIQEADLKLVRDRKPGSPGKRGKKGYREHK